jgi:hypothetical protein
MPTRPETRALALLLLSLWPRASTPKPTPGIAQLANGMPGSMRMAR